MKPNKDDSYFDFFRIGKSGELENEGFYFKARADSTKRLIDTSFSLRAVCDNNEKAQILMLRFLDSTLREINSIDKITWSFIFQILNLVIEQGEEESLSFDKMVAGNRLLKLIFIKENLNNQYSGYFLEKILFLIKQEAENLEATPIKNNNHGLQAIHALCVYETLILNRVENKYRKRLIKFFEEKVNNEGFFCENSQEYHFYGWELYEQFNIFDWYSSEKMKKKKEESKKLSRYLFSESGIPFSFGDTDTSLMIRHYKKRLKNEFDLTAPRKNLINFLESGFVYSKHTLKNKISSELLILNMYNGDMHNHHDYQSFEWIFGQDKIIVDPGKYSYAESKYKNYFYSGEAHNNTCARFSKKKDLTPKSFFMDSLRGDGKNTITCYTRFKNYSINRTLTHFSKEIIVEDNLQFDSGYKDVSSFATSLNLFKGFHSHQKLNDQSFHFESNLYILIITSSFPMKVYFGDDENCLGWMSEKYNTKEKCYYIEQVADANGLENTKLFWNLKLYAKSI